MNVHFATIESAKVEQRIIKEYEDITGSTLYPADPVRLFLKSLAYTIATLHHTIQLAAEQNILAFAQKGHLDAIGLLLGTTRLQSAPATCMQRFYVAEPLASAVTIPAGTRVTTADGKGVFATQHAAIIDAGNLFANVAITAMEHGSHLNGLVPSQIHKLIDPIAYVVTTENMTTTSLGADVESDEHFRERAQLAAEAFTSAGSIGAYRSHAMSAHQDIADVAVFSPRAGVVDIRPIMSGGILPSEEVLTLVRQKVSADDVRPLCDTVVVSAPEVVEYSLHVAYFITKTQTPLLMTIEKAVAQAVEKYRLWQRSVVGRDITPTKLISLMEQAGAYHVTPEFSLVSILPSQIAIEKEVRIRFLGVQDE